MATLKQPLSILCFGDSLTAGYSQYGLRFTPYSATMLKRLQEKLGNDWEIEVHTDGVSGDQVTEGFLRRMEKRYGNERTKEEPYDWVIFLGGTNDIAWGMSNVQIHAAITHMTNIPLENGARVLILTVPECHAKIESLDARRDELNQLIWDDGREDVYTLDLFQHMPYHSLSSSERKELWDDGLHFTPKGYEKIGNLVADRLIEILSPPPPSNLQSEEEVKS